MFQLIARVDLKRAVACLAAVAALSLVGQTASADKLQTYWTTDENVAKKIPMADGSNGWTKGVVGTVPQGFGKCIWFAWRNVSRTEKRKFFRAEFLRANGERFDIDDVQGFSGDSDRFPVIRVGLKKEEAGNPVVHEYRFSPQPKWERIKVINKQGNSEPMWLLQGEAWSACAKTRPDNLGRRVRVEQGSVGATDAMEGSPNYTEFYFFPSYSPIDPDAIPTFSADPSTGSWSFELVGQDPFGNPRPQGGVKWTSDGQGLVTGDEFDAAFDLLHTSSGAMSMFVFDAANQIYRPFEMMDFGPPWIEPFDNYLPNQPIIGWRAWEGLNDDPALDAIVTPQLFFSPPNALEVQQNTNIVRQFEGADQGQWNFTTWTFVPNGYQGGSQFVLFDDYEHGGPQHPALVGQFESNSQTLFIQCGDPNPVQVPYIVDQWVPIDVVVDLENDHCAVFYNQQPLCEYAWTAGAFGDNNGQLNIAAINLFANGSAPIFYDDMFLVDIAEPEVTLDLNGFSVPAGTHIGGGLGDLIVSDDQYLSFLSGYGQVFSDLHRVEVVITGTTSVPNPSFLDLEIETSINDTEIANATIELMNWNTGQFELIGNYQVTDSDGLFSFSDIDATDFVNSEGGVTILCTTGVSVPFFAYDFEAYFDKVKVTIRE